MSPLTQLAFWKSFLHEDYYSHDQVPDLTGKVAIVTGANVGLGYATTVAMAGHGAHVFLACRNQQRAQDAIDKAKAEIKAKFPARFATTEPLLDFVELDMNDLKKTRHSAQEWLKKGLPLHILVNNSGIYGGPLELSVDGIESEFAINHMGIKESQPSRIVTLSSYYHELALGMDYDTIYKAGQTPPPNQTTWDRYHRSKLANVLFTKALARRMANERQLFINCCHPGYVATRGTEINFRKSPGGHVPDGYSISTAYSKFQHWWSDWSYRMTAMPVERGVLTQLYLATSPEIENKGITGRYFMPVALEIEPSAYANDEKLQEELWTYNGYSHDQIPDLTGKVAIVTGANSGLGYATTVALAGHGARVFLACRSQQRAQEAIDKAKTEIKAKFPTRFSMTEPLMEFLELDMSDLNKAQHAAQ
ncbi:hypothetical protein BGX29_003448 [Mortierella sp. GBA35]|nr:hypothetical protein BGX29_003448 [Mortierella sp. GBA35]